MIQPNSNFSFKGIYTYLKFKLRLPRDQANIETTIEIVRSGAILTGSNLWVLVTAIFMASLGLNVNATAVIIGAMLISPLMGPIMAIGMGVAIHDFGLVFRALKNFALAVTLSIITSSLFFFISPLKVPGSELLARTSPTVYDVLIAIFGGLAGIIAGSSKLRQSNVIPGVAIATALMPPLCTVGFGIANLNPSYIFGAFYLFFINSVFISLATYMVVRLLNYPEAAFVPGLKARRIRTIIWVVVLTTLLPSVYLTFQIIRRYIFEEKTRSYVHQELMGQRRIVLKTETEFDKKIPKIKLTILGSEIDSLEVEDLKAKLNNYGLSGTDLVIKQGFGDVSSRGSLMGSISTSIENNSKAIDQVFRTLDSLSSKMKIRQSNDSLQAGVAREARSWMPELLVVKIDPASYFDASTNRTKHGWTADFRFTRRQSDADLNKLRSWLNKRLQGDTVILQVQ